MWGVSGKVILGVKLAVTPGQRQLQILDFRKESPDADHIVHLEGNQQGLSIWFSGLRQAGDFIVHWNSAAHPGEKIQICPLRPPDQYIAIRPDDMLSVQVMAVGAAETYGLKFSSDGIFPKLEITQNSVGTQTPDVEHAWTEILKPPTLATPIRIRGQLSVQGLFGSIKEC